MRDLYDVSIDGEHQEEQPGRRGPATTSSSHHGVADDDADIVASADCQYEGVRLVVNQSVVPVDLESSPEDQSQLSAVITLRLFSFY